MSTQALLIDLDGTLIDTNAIHVRAWVCALQKHGYKLAPDRIALEIGMGGDQLIPTLLGQEAEQRDGDALRKSQPRFFTELAKKEGIQLFPGVEKLLAECKRRKLPTALVTSSGKKHLAVVKHATGFDFSKHVDAIISSDDADTSKPAPDLILAAAKKLGLHPAQCAMLGDTPFDAQAAKGAGSLCIGLRCGGNTDLRLLQAGARFVLQEPADMLANLDDALHRISRTTLNFTQQTLENLMQPALDAARRALDSGDVPIGCAIYTGQGKLLAAAHNQMTSTGNPIAHAEIVAFNQITKAQGIRDLILVSTLEPCVMCTAAAMEAAVDTIVFALRAPADSGTLRVNPPTSPESQTPRIVGDILAKDSRALLQQWLDQNKAKPQANYVEQLLKTV